MFTVIVYVCYKCIDLQDEVPLLANPVSNQGIAKHKTKKIGCRGTLFIVLLILLLVVGVVIAVVVIFVQSGDSNSSSSSSTSCCMNKQCMYVMI